MSEELAKCTRRDFLAMTAASPIMASTRAADEVRDANPAQARSFRLGPTFDVGLASPADDTRELATHIDLARKTGANALIVGVATGGSRETFLHNLLHLQKLAAAFDDVALAPALAIFRQPKNSITLLPCLRDAQVVGADLNDLADWRAAGVGIMGLARDWKGPYGDGALERTDLGLTHLGASAIARMNAERIVIDLARLGRRASMEAIEASIHPMIFSHAGPLTHDQLQSCARRGGVIGVGSSETTEVIKEAQHLIDLLGVEHVAVSGELNDIVGLREGLRASGMSDAAIDLVSGGNFQRVFQEVWR